jgi:peptidoglycan/xylan/chitin deacetylase (PgdA/CDA1 family)
MGALHLGYHYVRYGSAPGPNCSPERLRRQIEALKADGYEIMTCGEIVRRVLAGRSLPEKHATLSFDDGLLDQYTTAFPILKELGVPATFFVVTCALDGKLPPVIGFQILIAELGAERLEREILPKVFAGTPYLDLLDPKRYDASGRKMGEAEEMRRIKWMFNHWPSQAFKQEKLDEMFYDYLGPNSQKKFVREYFISRDELHKMQESGMEIASHTETHPALDVTGRDDIFGELRLSQQAIRGITRSNPESFAWTFGGKFRPETREIVAIFFKSAWNFHSGLKEMPERPYHDLTDIPRLHEQVFNP